MSLTEKRIRQSLIEAGVKNLQDWGYPSANEDNILTDDIYKNFFLVMLQDNKGQGANLDTQINILIRELE